MKSWLFRLCLILIAAATSFAASPSPATLDFGAVEPLAAPAAVIPLTLPGTGIYRVGLATPLLRIGGGGEALGGIEIQQEQGWERLPLWPESLPCAGGRTSYLRMRVSMADRAGAYQGLIQVEKDGELHPLPCSLSVRPVVTCRALDHMRLAVSLGAETGLPAAAPVRLLLSANAPWRLALKQINLLHAGQALRLPPAEINLRLTGPDGLSWGPFNCASLGRGEIVIAHGEATGGREIELRLETWWQAESWALAGSYKGEALLEISTEEGSSGSQA